MATSISDAMDPHLRIETRDSYCLPNAEVQLQARYNHCGEAASEKCSSAATFVRRHTTRCSREGARLRRRGPSNRQAIHLTEHSHIFGHAWQSDRRPTCLKSR